MVGFVPEAKITNKSSCRGWYHRCAGCWKPLDAVESIGESPMPDATVVVSPRKALAHLRGTQPVSKTLPVVVSPLSSALFSASPDHAYPAVQADSSACCAGGSSIGGSDDGFASDATLLDDDGENGGYNATGALDFVPARLGGHGRAYSFRSLQCSVPRARFLPPPKHWAGDGGASSVPGRKIAELCGFLV